MLKLSQKYFVLAKTVRGTSQQLFRSNALAWSIPVSVHPFRSAIRYHSGLRLKDLESMGIAKSNIILDSDFSSIGDINHARAETLQKLVKIWNGFGVLETQKGVYEGNFAEGKFNGQGKIAYYNGGTLAGEFKDGKIWKGVSAYTDPSGDVYQYEYNRGKRNGLAKMILADGTTYEMEMRDRRIWAGEGIERVGGGNVCEGAKVYEGSFKAGLYHGKGKVYFADNKAMPYIEGEFKYGRLFTGVIRAVSHSSKKVLEENEGGGLVQRWVNGRQIDLALSAEQIALLEQAEQASAEMMSVVLPDGAVLEGETYGDLIYGTRTTKDGRVMTGFFKPDGYLWDCKGEMLLENGAVYEGVVRKELFYDLAKVTYPDGRSQVGEFHRTGKLWVGFGTVPLRNGNVYEGQVRNGQMTGRGKMTFAKESFVLEGEFVKGRLWQGVGTKRFKDGSVYEGEFQNGQRHGQGKLTYPDGRFHVGEFRGDALWIGTGTVKRKNDEIYQGEVQYGKYYGQGILTAGELQLKGEFKNGEMWNGMSVMRDGRVTRRWVDGTSTAVRIASSFPAIAPVVVPPLPPVAADAEVQVESSEQLEAEMHHDTSLPSSILSTNEGRAEIVTKPRVSPIIEAPSITSALSLEELWEKIKNLRGDPFTEEAPVTAQWEGLLEQINESSGGIGDDLRAWRAGSGSLSDQQAHVSQAAAESTSPEHFRDEREVGDVHETVPNQAKKSTKKEEKASIFSEESSKADVVEKDVSLSTKTFFPSGSGGRGRKTHWVDLPQDMTALSLGITPEVVLASRQMRFELADGTVLQGEWHGEKFFGQQVRPDGSISQGEFREDRLWNGRGTLALLEGNAYVGAVVNGKMHGQGKITYPDGRTLEGEFKEDALWRGTGVLTFETGNVYEGAFEEGKMHGLGKLTYADGESFEGEFKNGLAWTGVGVKFVSDIKVYGVRYKMTGEFRDGRLWNGTGTVKTPRGGFIYEGAFAEGKMHGQGQMTYADGLSFTGEFRDGKIWEGKGSRKLVSGDVYEGEFREGKMHGRGKLTSDGRMWEGEFKESRMWTGSGAKKLADGNWYEGELREGRKHGQGQIISPAGRVLAGEFRQDKLWRGAGKVTFNTGDVYEGEFSEGVPHGRGKVTYPDGRSHKGEFKDSKLWNGAGWLKLKEGNSFEGEFREGKYCGQGKYIYADGQTLEGEFRDGKLWQGAGVLKYDGGDVYEGEFSEGKMHGQGTLTHVDGQTLEGEFRDGKLWSGTGVVKFFSGDFYKGSLKENVFHGPGKYTYADGRCLEGEFMEGKVWNGAGLLRQESGEEYEGGFAEGVMHGQGKLTYADGGVLEGEFRAGAMWSGAGVLKLAEKVYQAELVDQAWQYDTSANTPDQSAPAPSGQAESLGEGKHALKDGCIYEQEMIDGKYTGLGKLTYPDGRILVGKFRFFTVWNDARVLEYVGGSVYDGIIEQGQMHGQGKLVYPDGRSCAGEFRQGELWNGQGLVFTKRMAMFESYLEDAEIRERGAFLCEAEHELSGEIREGKLWNGTCLAKFIHGDRYVREFREGKQQGAGKFL